MATEDWPYLGGNGSGCPTGIDFCHAAGEAGAWTPKATGRNRVWRAPPAVAGAPAAEPARPGRRGRGVDSPPELHRDGPSAAEPGHGAAPGPRARGPATRQERAA